MNSQESNLHPSRDELYQIRKKKVYDEIKAAMKIIEKGVEPLEIADGFISNAFKILEESIRKKFPEYSKKRINQEVHDLLSFNTKLKAKRKRGQNIG